MDLYTKAVRKEYKKLRESGKDFATAHNMVLDDFAGTIPANRNALADILRRPWRAIVDRKIGIKSGRGDAYKVLSLDVWGNRKDGYEINQSFNAGSIFIPESASDRDILRIMRDENYLSEASKGGVRLEDNNGMGEYLEIVDRKSGEPIYHLEKIEK